MKKVIIINRWSDDFADYINLIDHNLNKIIYVTNENGAKYIKDRKNIPHALYILDDLDDYLSLNNAVAEIMDEYSQIDHLIAMSEYDIKNAGKIRDVFNISGMTEITALNFTNKIIMKNALVESSIKMPAFLDDISKLDIFIKKHGFPFILKPRIGAASHGVYRINNNDDLTSFFKNVTEIEGYECEEFIDSPIIHIDGVVQNNEIIFVKGSKYIGTCLDYSAGKPLGSIIIDSKYEQNRIAVFTKEVINSLQLRSGVFHLEAFYTEDDLIFLEVGARQGGGEIVPLFKELYGVDLINCLFQTQVENEIIFSIIHNTSIGGFLLIPEPKNTPCIVNQVTSMRGHVNTLKKEILPQIDSILDGSGDYYFNSGRFLFIGGFEEINSDINYIIDNFKIKTTKLK